VTTDTHKRGKRADSESYFRPYTEDERAVLLDKLSYMYGRFVGAVAEGRKMKKAEVDAVGRGHVWSGAMAKPVKLVDRFGGIGDAIEEAKRRMGVAPGTRVQLIELPAPSAGLLGRLAGLVGARAAAPAAAAVGPAIEDVPALRELVRGLAPSILADPSSAQARLPFEVIWQ
jgi:protease-4